MTDPPNHTAAGKAGIAGPLAVEHNCPGHLCSDAFIFS
jgi:hypothetical protein